MKNYIELDASNSTVRKFTELPDNLIPPATIFLPAIKYPQLPQIGQQYDADTDTFIEYTPPVQQKLINRTDFLDRFGSHKPVIIAFMTRDIVPDSVSDAALDSPITIDGEITTTYRDLLHAGWAELMAIPSGDIDLNRTDVIQMVSALEQLGFIPDGMSSLILA